MGDLGAIKQNLYAVSPRLYATAYRLYRSTPYARRRIARIDGDVARKFDRRLAYEAAIVRKYLDDDWTVRHGPFAGLRYAAVAANSLLSPKIIGSYESPIHRWIDEAIGRRYDTILDIGCAEGYYAAGLAVKSARSEIHAYDTDGLARRHTAALARLNGVSDRVHLHYLCTIAELDRRSTRGTLIVCDIEGAELDLLRPDLAPRLAQPDLIIESHDDRRPGITDTLVRRFLPTHRIEIAYHCVKLPAEFPALAAVPASEHETLLAEGRPRAQCWMRLLANPPGSVEPGNWWIG